MKAIFRILGTAAAVAATGAAIVIMDKFLNEKAAPFIESIEFPEDAEQDDAEAAKTAEAYAEGEAKAEAEAAAPAEEASPAETPADGGEQVPDETAANPFTDVPESAYYYAPVQWAVAQGITAGRTETTFAPGENCTRANIVTFLWRAAGSPEPKGAASGMTDVVSGSYYEKAVAWAIENGITTGTTTSTFSPDATCTLSLIHISEPTRH